MMVSVISDDALAVIFSGSQLAANARRTVALATADERLFVRWLPIKKTGSVRVAVSANPGYLCGFTIDSSYTM